MFNLRRSSADEARVYEVFRPAHQVDLPTGEAEITSRWIQFAIRQAAAR